MGKRLYLSVFVLLGLGILAGCNPEKVSCVEGDGNVITRERGTGLVLFKSVVNEGAANVELIRTPSFITPTVQVKTDSNLQDNLKLSVIAEALYLQPRTCIQTADTAATRVTISSYYYTIISNRGRHNLVSYTPIQLGLWAENIGSGYMELLLIPAPGTPRLQNSGTGNFTIRGNIASANVVNGSTGVFDCRDLTINTANVTLSGPNGRGGRIYLNVTGSVDGLITGGDTLFLRGGATNNVVVKPGATGLVIIEN